MLWTWKQVWLRLVYQMFIYNLIMAGEAKITTHLHTLMNVFFFKFECKMVKLSFQFTLFNVVGEFISLMFCTANGQHQANWILFNAVATLKNCSIEKNTANSVRNKNLTSSVWLQSPFFIMNEKLCHNCHLLTYSSEARTSNNANCLKKFG